MKRPLFVIGVAYGVTTWFAFVTNERTALLLSFACAASAVLCFVLRARFRPLLAVCAVFLASAAAFGGYSLYRTRQIAPVERLAGQTVIVEGVITDAKNFPAYTSYTLKAAFPGLDGLPDRVPLIIQDRGDFGQTVGDTVRCKVYLKLAPRTNWYKSRGIAVVGRKARDVESIPAGRWRFDRALVLLREKLSQNVYAKLSPDNAAVVTAMVLGMKDDVSPEIYDAVNRSGTSHLLSVSGLHLSIIAAFALGLLNALRCPRRASAVITILLCFLFAALVGFGASIFRSFVMTAITLSGRMFSRRGDSRTSLGLAILICCAAWPFWALSFGLWLSCGSTLGIIMFAGKLSDKLFARFSRDIPLADRFIKAFTTGISVSVSAYAFTLPMLFVLSGWISLVSPVANVLVSPFIPAVIIGGVLCALVPGASLFAQLAGTVTDFCVTAVVRISRLCGSLAFATMSIDESYLLIWLGIAIIFLILLVVFRADKKLVSYALALLAVCLSVGDLSLAAAKRNSVELVTLSGCDTALLLRGREAVLLGTPDQYEISALMRYMNFRGVKSVPAIIASDCGDTLNTGLLRMTSSYDVDCVVGPDDAYILSQLETGLKNSLIYSGGYADITVLGSVKIETALLSGDIYLRAGNTRIIKTAADYSAMNGYDGKTVSIYNGGVMLLPVSARPAFEPAGAFLFGESRVLLPLGG